ncbi:MAG: hypothetical protein ACXACD_12845, partial [Candidatus Thorarchaeota archaeon]
IDLYIAGTLEAKLYFWGMKDGGNDLAPYNQKLIADIPQATQDAVAAARAEILAGDYVVPYIPEETVWP